MRQHASELVRRAGAGEQLTITVAGRPAAVLGPVNSRVWRHWDDLAEIFSQSEDAQWATDRELLDGGLIDPWERR